MKCLILLSIFAVLAFGAPSQELDWSKYDTRLLEKYGPPTTAGTVEEEGSGFEPAVVAGGAQNVNGTTQLLSNGTTQVVNTQAVNNTVIKDEEVVEKCDNGWIRYDNSCYYIERTTKASVKAAEKVCHDKKSTLFVADSKVEYDFIMNNAPNVEFIWTGLHQKNEKEKALWQAPTDFDYKDLKWLINPYNAASNGWTTMANCAAFYNGLSKYAYWYPCDWSFFYVCEKNFAFEYSPSKTRKFF